MRVTFSATMPASIRRLVREILNDPVTVQIDCTLPAKTVSHAIYPVQQHLKTTLLKEILNKIKSDSVLVFTRTKHRAERVAAGFDADEPGVGAINAWVEEGYDKIAPKYKEIMPKHEAYTKFIASLELANPKSFPFSNLLLRRRFVLDTKSVLQRIHVAEDAPVAKTVIKQGYKIVKIPKILGIHYHQDPVVYARMAHRRWGESVVKAKGKLRGYRHLITPPVMATYYWLRFSIHSHQFDFRLYWYLISLYIEFEKGIISRFWATLHQRSG